MKKVLYIFKSGKLSRKDNTLLLEGEDFKKVIPVESVLDINVFGEIRVNSKLLVFLSQKHIALHVFNHYGYYVGTFYPREYYNSGLMVLLQAEHYLDINKRMFLAKSFIKGSVMNMAKNLRRYGMKDESEEIITALKEKLDSIGDTSHLMALEGNIRERYYSLWENILSDNFKFEKRTRRPPKNPLNALISFGNSLLYVSILSAIYRTHLDPRIGYLHETNRRSFTLNLDIAEVFKPILVDRVIFKLVNRGQITDKHFISDANMTYLNEKGLRIFVQEFERKMQSTISYSNLGKVSYRKLLRLECYKLYKHFLGEKLYEPFVIKD